MKRSRPSLTFARLALALLTVCLAALPLTAASTPRAEPVTPNALPETRALLQLLYDLSGQHTLTGQHNYPNIKDRNTRFAAAYIGKTPAVFSTDWGHAKDGDSDSYLARPDIVQECIRQHKLGALITICWHAVPPTADEPITFARQPNSDPNKLTSVQGKLLDEQFRDVLTPGTALHTKWMAQVDAIAVFLKQLEDARVPILWRPYHEMNGDWFWWGGRTGEYSTIKLYQQIFDRLVHHHRLRNLVWIWSVDRVSRPGMEHEKFYPGTAYLDVLGLDVYGNDFAQSYYDSLEKLSEGKPLALAEIGNVPSLEVFAKQPKWTFFVSWAGMTRNTTREHYNAINQDPRFLSLDDPAYADVTADYRRALNLPLVQVSPPPANFSGTWFIDDAQSNVGRQGLSTAPAKMEITHRGDDLSIRSTRILEFADDQITEERHTLDGRETTSEFMNSPRVSKARLSDDGSRLLIDSTVSVSWGPPGTKLNLEEVWTLSDDRRQLTIERSAQTPQGRQTTTLVFHRP